MEKVAFISGGGSGIGEAAAALLARRGVKVALAGRTPDELTEVAESIRASRRVRHHRDLRCERRRVRTVCDSHDGAGVGQA